MTSAIKLGVRKSGSGATLQPNTPGLSESLGYQGVAKRERILNVGPLLDATENTYNVKPANVRTRLSKLRDVDRCDPGASEVNRRMGCIRKFCCSTAHRLTIICTVAMLAGCATTADDLVPDKSMVGAPVGAVGHYGSQIVITDYSIDGYRGLGFISGWGGGGADTCCILLPRKITKPMIVTVKWTTTRSNIDELREHEATVPVNFAVQPGDGGSGLYVHFLPGHTAEVWYAGPTPPSSEYPGPAFPRGPAPIYVPLPDEKSQPVATK